MDTADRSSLMGFFMKDYGRMESHMDKERWLGLMVLCKRESLSMDQLMVKVITVLIAIDLNLIRF